MRELYQYRWMKGFEGSGITKKSVNRKFYDDLQVEDFKNLIYVDSG